MILPALRRSPELGEQPPGERRGRHQSGREFRRVDGKRARGIAALLFGAKRACGEQHGALAPVGHAIEHAALAVFFQDRERAFPVAGRATEFEYRLARPRQARAHPSRPVRRTAAPLRNRCAAAPRHTVRAGRAIACRRAPPSHGMHPRRPHGRHGAARSAPAAAARAARPAGSSRHWRRKRCAARASPAPIAIRPREIASYPLRRLRSRSASENSFGERSMNARKAPHHHGERSRLPRSP